MISTAHAQTAYEQTLASAFLGPDHKTEGSNFWKSKVVGTGRTTATVTTTLSFSGPCGFALSRCVASHFGIASCLQEIVDATMVKSSAIRRNDKGRLELVLKGNSGFVCVRRVPGDEETHCNRTELHFPFLARRSAAVLKTLNKYFSDVCAKVRSDRTGPPA